jgi:hypothetical protein
LQMFTENSNNNNSRELQLPLWGSFRAIDATLIQPHQLHKTFQPLYQLTRRNSILQLAERDAQRSEASSRKTHSTTTARPLSHAPELCFRKGKRS